MNAKEILKSIKRYEVLISIEEAEIEEIRERMSGLKAISYEPKIGCSGSMNTKSPQEKLFPELYDKQVQLAKDIKKLIEYKSSVLKIIKRMDNPEHMQLLTKRYFEYKKWEKIAVEMNYSYRNIIKMHGEALINFNKFAHDYT